MTHCLNTLANLISAVYLAGTGSGTAGRSCDFFYPMLVIQCSDGHCLYWRISKNDTKKAFRLSLTMAAVFGTDI